jgi:hypothetical protein
MRIGRQAVTGQRTLTAVAIEKADSVVAAIESDVSEYPLSDILES